MKRRSKVFGLLAVLGFVLFNVVNYGASHSLTFQTSQDILFTFRPMLSLSIFGDLTINELVPGTQEYSDNIAINVDTNASEGYYLTATVGSSSTDDRLINQDNSDYYFENLTTRVGKYELPDNTWGYNCQAIVGGGVSSQCDLDSLSGLPLDADDTGATGAVLLDVNKPTNRGVSFRISAKASNSQPAGTYTNVINFYAVTEPIPEPKTINDLEYLQEFKTLSYVDKATVLASMPLNQQYQLKDQRDNKEYYIAKLRDGNVWMTQNLDHDIVTSDNYYTSENTDIPEDKSPLKMNTATYATDDNTWHYYGGEYIPESYDPGDKCWNGDFKPDGYGTLNDMTDACTDFNKHYSIGNYYNWTAAVAMNDSSSYTTRYRDVDQSICPAGWRLPTYSGDKSYQNLVTILSLTAGYRGNIHRDPVYFTYGGGWNSNSWQIGSFGYYNTSVIVSQTGSYALMFYERSSYPPKVTPNYGSERYSGHSVRCVAR